MYNDFFGLREAPFSIAPDPRYLYLSERHKEALAHLMYGVQGQGGFIVITGEVGTGKTTVCRCFLESVPEHVDIALVLNPKLSARELLASICDELQLRYPAGSSIKRLIDLINSHLLNSHSQGRHTVLVIDEAQNLSADVLEQLRLLTNLETAEKKLLQIVLLGQPELQDILAAKELRQLSQRITARYHLGALDRQELVSYLRYRLNVAGSRQAIFLPPAVKLLYRFSEGIPRLVNLVADRALLGAYAQNISYVDARTVKQAAKEVFGERRSATRLRGSATDHGRHRPFVLASLFVGVVAVAASLFGLSSYSLPTSLFNGGAESVSVPQLSSAAVVAAEVATETPVSNEGAAAEAIADDPAAQPSPAGPPVAGVATADDGLFANWKPDNRNTRNAYRELFRLWGLNPANESFRSACDFAEEQGMRCLHRQGNWRSLEQLNRPALLQLHNNNGDAFHIVLQELEGNMARIALGSERYTLPRSLIDQHWLGDYSLIWRLPPYESKAGSPAMDKAQWLSSAMAQLRALYKLEPELAATLARAPLGEQVAWFQRRAGVIPDGIPGAVTLININNALDPSGPRLSPLDESKHLAHQD